MPPLGDITGKLTFQDLMKLEESFAAFGKATSQTAEQFAEALSKLAGPLAEIMKYQQEDIEATWTTPTSQIDGDDVEVLTPPRREMRLIVFESDDE